MSGTAPRRRLRFAMERKGAHSLGRILETLGAEVELEDLADGRGEMRAVFDPEVPPYLEDRVEFWVRTFDPEAELWTAREGEPWEDGWRGIYEGYLVGSSFAIHPPWREPPAQRLAICLDPRGAFGSGGHPATRATLRAMEKVLPRGANPPARLLDVGCGTGILSLAAARLGLIPTAIDLEPGARASCRRCSELNGVEIRVLDEVRLEDLGERYPYVVANLDGTDVVLGLAGALLAALEPGGTLVLSGFSVEDTERVIAAFAPPLELVEQLTEGPAVPYEWSCDWRALVLRSPE